MSAEAVRDTPDAMVLGARAVRLEQICREGQAADAGVRAEMPAVLTESQRAKWQELERAIQLLPALGDARDVNLARRSPPQALPPHPFLPASPPGLVWNIFVSPGQTFPGCETGTASARWFNVGSLTLAGQSSSRPPLRDFPSSCRARPDVTSGWEVFHVGLHWIRLVVRLVVNRYGLFHRTGALPVSGYAT